MIGSILTAILEVFLSIFKAGKTHETTNPTVDSEPVGNCQSEWLQSHAGTADGDKDSDTTHRDEDRTQT